MPDRRPALDRRRVVVVVARCAGVPPPGVPPDAFAAACLADTYEVLADLVGVDCAVAGPESVESLLWPGHRRLPAEVGLVEAATLLRDYDELVLVPADVPDLPGLVVAKVFRALQSADVCIAPDRFGPGCVAVGVRLPIARWLPTDLDLDRNRLAELMTRAPRRSLVREAPDWHRMSGPDAVHRLDPRLEGWEETRALLTGRRLGSG
jgi:hypothetical protein